MKYVLLCPHKNVFAMFYLYICLVAYASDAVCFLSFLSRETGFCSFVVWFLLDRKQYLSRVLFMRQVAGWVTNSFCKLRIFSLSFHYAGRKVDTALGQCLPNVIDSDQRLSQFGCEMISTIRSDKHHIRSIIADTANWDTFILLHLIIMSG